VVGDLDSFDGIARQHAIGAGAVVVSVDYRLAPEHPYPAAVEDAWAATQWVAGHADELGADPARLAVAGDSAGGNLAAVVTQLARDDGGPPIAFQLLWYPGTTWDSSLPSITENANAPIVDAAGIELHAGWYQFWEENRLQAYEGVSLPGFPNFFTVAGPYGFNGASFFAYIETQTHHIVRCLKHAARRGATRVEVTEEANDRYFTECMRKRHTQIFWQDSCSLANSYYFDSRGDVPLRRATTLGTIWRSRRFPLADYAFTA
jgi:alpha/beta hydrolase fold